MLFRRIRTPFIVGVLLVIAPATAYAAQSFNIRAVNNDFQRMQLVATATPSNAAESTAIQVDVRLVNPTSKAISFPALNSFFSEIGVNVKTTSGVEIKPDHEPIFSPFSRIRYFVFQPGTSTEGTTSLYNLGHTLKSGTYVVDIANYTMADNLKPIYAAPITITISK